MTDFVSYYWNPSLLADPQLADAFARVRDDALSAAERAAAMAKLLDSGDDVAEGLAFDWAFYEISRMRFGNRNPFESHAKCLLERARRQLARPPVAGARLDGKTYAAANHASALGVLSRIGEPGDLDLAAGALLNPADGEVFWSACDAAKHCLRLGERPSASMLAHFVEMARDLRREEDYRLAAIDVIGACAGDEAVAELIQLGEEGPLRLTIQSAWRLAGRRKPDLRPLLDRWMSRWPPDAPYPAWEVRAELSRQDEELAEAKQIPDEEPEE